MNAVIGELKPNEQEVGPATGFQRFESKLGVHGLAKVVNQWELHVLAIAAITPGIGQFRKFVEAAKNSYRFIRFWSVMDDEFRVVLARYGFVRGDDVDRFGEMQEVWDWQ